MSVLDQQPRADCRAGKIEHLADACERVGPGPIVRCEPAIGLIEDALMLRTSSGAVVAEVVHGLLHHREHEVSVHALMGSIPPDQAGEFPQQLVMTAQPEVRVDAAVKDIEPCLLKTMRLNLE